MKEKKDCWNFDTRVLNSAHVSKAVRAHESHSFICVRTFSAIRRAVWSYSVTHLHDPMRKRKMKHVPPLYRYTQKLKYRIPYFSWQFPLCSAQIHWAVSNRLSCFASKFSRTQNYRARCKVWACNKLWLAYFGFMHFNSRLFSMHSVWCLT
jgi:hypothetical protein